MFNKEFLKTLTIMYVEDDESIRESLSSILSKVFKEVVLCEDGQDGIDRFKLYTQNLGQTIDAVVSDINMPRKSGLEMLKEIRELDSEVPAILTTAHGEANFLMDAIKVNVSYYALKPIDTPLLLQNIQKFCMIKHNQKLIKRKEKELSAYIKIINQVATVAKTNSDGNFVEVNDHLCIVTGYTKEELLTKNIRDITHDDALNTSYVKIFASMNNEQEWEGLHKGIDKDGEEFYLKISIIPELNDSSNTLVDFIVIGFETTADEKDRQNTMIKVRHNIIEQKRKEAHLLNKIKMLESKLSTQQSKLSSEADTKFLIESLDKYKAKNNKLINQVNHYEKEITKLKNKLDTIVSSENTKRADLLAKNKQLQAEIDNLQKNLIHTQNKLTQVQKKLENKEYNSKFD